MSVESPFSEFDFYAARARSSKKYCQTTKCGAAVQRKNQPFTRGHTKDQLLLVDTRTDSTERYLGVEREDALSICEPVMHYMVADSGFEPVINIAKIYLNCSFLLKARAV